MKKKMIPAMIALGVAVIISIAGCSSSKKKNMEDGAYQPEEVPADELTLEVGGDSDSGKAGPIRTVFFPFDSSSLTDSTREQLRANADFLRSNESVEVQVEGHCDERGGVQYNMALGERRAKAVKDFLVASGIAAGRISTVSFGKERPLVYGSDESSWAQNRRGNFVITAK